ncbi:MAG: hypothetical protein VB013_02625 [Anaerolineaceae bacterium]|nr:hypothetical protein [Anaerolineaceae bacterium]
MKKRLLTLTILLIASVLVLAACNRSRLRQGITDSTNSVPVQTQPSEIEKFTEVPSQAATTQTQPTQAPTEAVQATSSTTDTSAVSSDLNELSNLFDTLNSDLNSTDTLSDFK